MYKIIYKNGDMMEICKEIIAKNKKYKAVIFTIGGIYRVQLFEYLPECVDDDGDVWEALWQEVTTSNTITDTEQNAIKLAEEELNLLN
ncbi:hypothetical protein [Psychrobacillus sp. OK032]|uniref:hypothetical protein n=1 Tax=Psychrobacillus sp. OK032 TaxID=1884358 RepID=UPI0008C96486|nr:hypothetical protein [Psychrobacillus sp. OK032]SES46081.1 hypothetical protein SAMN05518872_1239 [Psychrobacillus sp. OK032]